MSRFVPDEHELSVFLTRSAGEHPKRALFLSSNFKHLPSSPSKLLTGLKTRIMASGGGGEKSPELDWLNVGIGFGFIIFNVILSSILGIEKDISASLVIAALRCIGQLSLLTVILKPVFNGGPWAVAGIVFLFNILGTFEAGECISI